MRAADFRSSTSLRAVEARTAEIYSCPLSLSGLFGWKWRAKDRTQESPYCFVFQRDCVVDAKRNGFSAELAAEQRD